MNQSCGIIPFRLNPDGVCEYFVGHPGGPSWQRMNYWAFMKGGVENGENWLEAALREFREESGVDLSLIDGLDFMALGNVRQNKHKMVCAFGVAYGDINPKVCFSNKADNCEWNEIDDYRWMTYEVLKKCTNPAHLGFYEKIEEMVKQLS